MTWMINGDYGIVEAKTPEAEAEHARFGFERCPSPTRGRRADEEFFNILQPRSSEA